MTKKTRPSQYFEAIFGALPDPVAIIDGIGKILDVNPAYAALFNTPKSELVGKAFAHFSPISDAVSEQFMSELMSELRKHKTLRLDTMIPSIGGTSIWAKVTASLLEHEGQTLCLASLHDISDQRRMEGVLRKSGEKLRRVFRGVSDGIVVTDLNGLITEINQRAIEISGCSSERQALNKHLKEILGTDSDRATRLLQDAVEHGTVRDVEFTLHRKDGSQLFLEISVSVLRTSEYEPQGYIAVLRDISERKETAELHRQVVNASPVYIAQGGRFRFANSRFQEISGYSEEELLNMPASKLVHPDDRRKVRERALHMVKGIPVPPGEFRIVTKNGETKWAMETVSSIVYHGSRASLGNFVDITERHNAEIALRKVLEASEKSRAEVTALLEASQAVLEHPVFKDAATEVFRICKKLTGATGGYIVLLDATGTKYNALFLDAGDGQCSVDPALPMPLRGMRQEACSSGKPVFDNAFQKGKWAKLIPPGHVQLSNVMFAPLAVEGKPVGLVGLANKPGGFAEDDSRLVSGLTNFMAVALSNSNAWESLQKSENRYRDLYRQAPVAFFAVGPDDIIQAANDKAVELMGYGLDELIGRPMAGLFVDTVSTKELPAILPVRSTHSKLNGGEEIEMQRKDGNKVWVSLSIEKVTGDDGRIVASRIAALDVTDRRRAETERARSEERASSITETATDAIISIDNRGDVILCNPAAEKMFGYSAAEIIGRQVTEIMPPAQVDSHIAGLKRVVSGGETRLIGHTVETVGLRKSGEKFPMELSLAEWTTDEGKFFTAIVRDITARKRMDAELLDKIEELQEANRRLKELDRLKDGFLSTVSHELRTPLTSIKSFAEILMAYDEDKATRQEFLGIINEESGRLTRLINDFLDLSKIQAGRMQWETSEVSLPSVIEMALHANHSLIVQNKLQITTSIEPDLPQVLSDVDRITQVVTNLLSNAIKFTPEGGKIIVHAEKTTGEPSKNDMVTVSVTDSGIGIAPEHHQIVFEKFTQVGDTLKDRPKGSGLGLPICKEIVEHYGGRIWVESKLGSGSTFRFTLPIVQRSSPPPPENKPKALPVAQAAKTILVVDDEANIRRAIGHELASRGYRVIEAANGREAIDLARQHIPNLITMDVVLPDLDGLDVTTVLKSDPLTKDIPILVVSVFEDKSKAYRLGANDCITKPFEIDDLLSKASRLLADAQKTILVVDDDRNLVKTLDFELRKRGFTVHSAYNGEEALIAVQRHPPNLILLDIKMPGMDGYALLKLLKGNPGTAAIPIVLMTGVNIDGGRVTALSIGAADYYVKGDETSRLFDAVERILHDADK